MDSSKLLEMISEEEVVVLDESRMNFADLFHLFGSVVIDGPVDMSLLNTHVTPQYPIKKLCIGGGHGLLNPQEVCKVDLEYGSVLELRISDICNFEEVMRRYGALKLVVGGIEINAEGTRAEIQGAEKDLNVLLIMH
jgi:hypothetical protein